MLAWVRTPPRWRASSSFTLRNWGPVTPGDAVMRRQGFVDAREVGGEELEDAQVAAQHLAEKVDRLQPHGRRELVVEAGIAVLVDGHALQAIEFQPLLGELLDERSRPWGPESCGEPARTAPRGRAASSGPPDAGASRRAWCSRGSTRAATPVHDRSAVPSPGPCGSRAGREIAAKSRRRRAFRAGCLPGYRWLPAPSSSSS